MQYANTILMKNENKKNMAHGVFEPGTSNQKSGILASQPRRLEFNLAQNYHGSEIQYIFYMKIARKSINFQKNLGPGKFECHF